MTETQPEKGSVERRLNLVRYGMVIIVVLAFGITAAYGIFANLTASNIVVAAVIDALIAAVITGVAMVAVYFGYAAYLKRGQ